MVEMMKITMEKEIMPYMQANHLDHDRVLAAYIKVIVDHALSIYLICVCPYLKVVVFLRIQCF